MNTCPVNWFCIHLNSKLVLCTLVQLQFCTHFAHSSHSIKIKFKLSSSQEPSKCLFMNESLHSIISSLRRSPITAMASISTRAPIGRSETFHNMYLKFEFKIEIRNRMEAKESYLYSCPCRRPFREKFLVKVVDQTVIQSQRMCLHKCHK